MNFLTQEEDMLLNNGLQAIYFYAPWVPYHSKFIIMLDKMEKKYLDISFHAIDTDQFNSQCKRFSVDSIPTVLILKSGKEVKRICGLTLTSAFKSVFADICNLESKNGED